SDWFWWLGDDHPTAYLSEFESLFRANLAHVCRRIGRRPPPGLDEPIARREPAVAAAESPIDLITPRIDGRAESYYDWVGAGVHRPVADGGAMRLGAAPLVRELRFGFDRDMLYLLVAPDPARREALGGALARIKVEPLPEGSATVIEWSRGGGIVGATGG